MQGSALIVAADRKFTVWKWKANTNLSATDDGKRCCSPDKRATPFSQQAPGYKLHHTCFSFFASGKILLPVVESYMMARARGFAYAGVDF